MKRSAFFRRGLALLLCLLMAASLTACGCGTSGGGGTGTASLGTDAEALKLPLAEKVTIKGLTNFPAGFESEPNNRTIFKRPEVATNVHVEWRTILMDQWGDKISLEMANAKTLPEFVFNAQFSDTDLLKYAKQGAIINLEDYIDTYMSTCARCLNRPPNTGPCVPTRRAISGRCPGLSSLVMKKPPSRPWAT